jgi:hypothetical protein
MTMTTLAWVFAAILAVFLVYTMLAPTVLGLPAFMRTVNLACPYHPAVGRIRLNGVRAALTGAYGRPSLRVVRCNLLAPGKRCDQACLKDWKES